MKVHPQTIYAGSKPQFVVLQAEEYKSLIQTLEDFTDIQEIRSSLKNPDATFPMKVVMALANGESPIKVYRKHRNISQAALADKVGVTRQYIIQLEKGKRTGGIYTLKAIAKALNVDFDDLVN